MERRRVCTRTDIPKSNRWTKWKERLAVWAKGAPEWAVMLTPAALLTVGLLQGLLLLRYPKIEVHLSWGLLLVSTLGLLPTIVIGAMKLIGRFGCSPVRRGVRIAATVLCAVYYILFGVLMTVLTLFGFTLSSQTDDIANYRFFTES
ncbi:MAG: hypothetical protein IJZ74_02620 [Clostridia bacterium]|nr:hypothetical protein [Clostridia bacterium]